MQITKRQRKEIIKKAIKLIEADDETFLCGAFTKAIKEVLKTYVDYIPEEIQKYVPEFTFENALRFNANGGYVWWNHDNYALDKQYRLNFLHYLLEIT